MIRNLVASLSAVALCLAATTAFAQSAPADKRASSESARQTPAQAGKQGSRLSKQDRQYFRDLAQDNLAEVEAGKLAQQRASGEEVKDFAERMVKDHGEMLEEGQQMASAKGLDMPRQPKKEHRSAMQKLKKAKAEQFDRAYMSQMVKDHEKTLKQVQRAAKNAKDPQLKAMAQKAEPIIKEHLEMAKDISDKASAGRTAKNSSTPK